MINKILLETMELLLSCWREELLIALKSKDQPEILRRVESIKKLEQLMSEVRDETKREST